MDDRADPTSFLVLGEEFCPRLEIRTKLFRAPDLPRPLTVWRGRFALRRRDLEERPDLPGEVRLVLGTRGEATGQAQQVERDAGKPGERVDSGSPAGPSASKTC